MAKICCGSAVSEGEASTPYEPSSRAARRRRMKMRRFRFGGSEDTENEEKRQKLGPPTGSVSRDYDNAFENTLKSGVQRSETKGIMVADRTEMMSPPLLSTAIVQTVYPKFGMASICGRRRDMKDAVVVHPFFCRREHDSADELHYFGVYDGHGGSHVAMMCRDRLHEVVKEELENKEARTEWKNAMVQSFNRMDKEVISWNDSMLAANCRCELQSPECDAVGFTAVVAIVTPDKISSPTAAIPELFGAATARPFLCLPITRFVPKKPLNMDWFLDYYGTGSWTPLVLAMSRAIGNNYLKPYVSCDPEVTVTDRTAMDDCLILASDGLWDVVSNDTACGVPRTCLRGKAPAPALALGPSSSSERESGGENADKACSDASMLLTKLALSRRTSDNVSVVVVDLRRDT